MTITDTQITPAPLLEATITEQGNGFPSVGTLLYDADSNSVYKVVSIGNIQTGRSSGAGNWCTATLEDAEETDPTAYSDEAWEELSDCRVEIHAASESSLRDDE